MDYDDDSQNARDEMIQFLRRYEVDGRELVCADIKYDPEFWGDKGKYFRLRTPHSPHHRDKWLDSLNFTYDAGYGGQQLYGTLWFSDGTWASRGEYDGKEWWDFMKVPEIPKELQSLSDTQLQMRIE